ncbi:MAG: hypothetical protein KKF22_10050 [Gammaproteobacteria bacterium]|nr:hypothetical protein [Gammaproteobacteria bacterium]
MKLDVLIVEDDGDYLAQLKRDLPDVFSELGIDVKLHLFSNFDEALVEVKNSHVRYDLVISDTYKGEHKNRNAAVLETIAEYRKGKFCSVIVCSSGECPPELKTSPFVYWVDKGKQNALDDSIRYILKIGVPQISRKLHEELENSAGKYLWGFLEDNWNNIKIDSQDNYEQLERLVRRRAALIISDLKSDEYVAIDSRHGLEYYIYPSLDHDYYSLGDILRNNNDPTDIRIILTPHCHLFKQDNAIAPRAEFILTIRAECAKSVLGDKIDSAKKIEITQQLKKLRIWANSPAQTEKRPVGRHWYLPKFLDIPHLYCDFLQVNSIQYSKIEEDYQKIATLAPPYAEALQECFSSFYGSVGIPTIKPVSILDLLE